MLAEIGIETALEVERLGAPMAYRLLKHRFPGRINRIALWALAGALEDRHWTSFSDQEKAALDREVEGDLEVGAR